MDVDALPPETRKIIRRVVKAMRAEFDAELEQALRRERDAVLYGLRTLATLNGSGAAVLGTLGGRVEKAITHAPAGGVTVNGKEFRGGQFIPAEDLKNASPEEKADLKAKAKQQSGQYGAWGQAAAGEPESATELSTGSANDTAVANPAAPAKRPTVDQSEALARRLMSPGGPDSGETVRRLHEAFRGHTLKELAELKRRLGIKADGPKDALARKLAERAAAYDRSDRRKFTNEKITVDDAHERVKAMAAAGDLATGKGVRELADTLAGGLTGAELNELKTRLGIKAGGPKAELARKLVERAVNGETVKQKPPEKQGEPAAGEAVNGETVKEPAMFMAGSPPLSRGAAEKALDASRTLGGGRGTKRLHEHVEELVAAGGVPKTTTSRDRHGGEKTETAVHMPDGTYYLLGGTAAKYASHLIAGGQSRSDAERTTRERTKSEAEAKSGAERRNMADATARVSALVAERPLAEHLNDMLEQNAQSTILRRPDDEVRRDESERHRQAVESTLAAGKPVPPEVLADYPDLKPKAPAADQPAPTPASPAPAATPSFFGGVVSDPDQQPLADAMKASARGPEPKAAKPARDPDAWKAAWRASGPPATPSPPAPPAPKPTLAASTDAPAQPAADLDPHDSANWDTLAKTGNRSKLIEAATNLGLGDQARKLPAAKIHALLQSQAKPPEPVAKPNDAPKPSARPDVTADAATNPQKYEREGRAVLSDPAVRQAFVDAADHLSQFVEYQDGLIELPRMYREVAKRVPGLTVPQFQAAVWQVKESRAVELHVLNETRGVGGAETEGSLKVNRTGKLGDDRLYHYVRFPRAATADALTPSAGGPAQSPTNVVDKPTTVGNNTPVPPQSAGANTGGGTMATTGPKRYKVTAKGRDFDYAVKLLKKRGAKYNLEDQTWTPPAEGSGSDVGDSYPEYFTPAAPASPPPAATPAAVKYTSTGGQGVISGQSVKTDTLRMPHKGGVVDAGIDVVKLDAPQGEFTHAMVADAGAAGIRWRLFRTEADAVAELDKAKAAQPKGGA